MNFPTTNNGFRQASQASGIGVPSYRRIGVTKPSYKEKPLLQEIHPFSFQ